MLKYELVRRYLTILKDVDPANLPKIQKHPLVSVVSFIGKPFYYLLIIIVVILYVVSSRFDRFLLKSQKSVKLSLFRLSKSRLNILSLKEFAFKEIVGKINVLSVQLIKLEGIFQGQRKKKISKKTIQVYPKPFSLRISEKVNLKKFYKPLFSRALSFIKNLLFIPIFTARVFYKITEAFLILMRFIVKIVSNASSKLKLKLPKTPTKQTVKKYKYVKPAIDLKLLLFTLSFFMFFITPVTILNSLTHDLPSPNKLKERKVNVSTKIYDRNGILLYTIFKDENRTPLSIDEIPLHVKLATLAAEDAEFYDHPGFSVRGIFRAAVRNLKEDDLEGGSTITQQLVKNTLLTSERTLQRKIREIILAIKVERKYTKDEILEMYLNEVSYGGVAYGIQEAAKVYFGKDVDRLTLGEAALLAGLPQSPTKYSPFGADPELALNRQMEVLWLMQVNGYIPESQRLKAEEEKISFSKNRFSIRASHFVAYVRNVLEEKYGISVVENGGLEVRTSLDYGIQQLMEEIVRNEVNSLNKLNVGNGGLIVLDPENGEILAMVGSKDYFDIENQGNVNVTTSLRQPGSSIKLINYAYALSNGYTAASILEDSPVTYQIDGQEPYTPRNYDNRFRGNLSLRSSFSESRNVPAVKTLESYGVTNMIEMGRKMGITTWNDPENYGLSLTLGGGEVKLIDLAQAYATVANAGNRPPLTPILNVKDYQGNMIDDRVCIQTETSDNTIIAEQVRNPLLSETKASSISGELQNNFIVGECETKEVLDPRVAFILTDILKDNEARSPAFGNNSQLVIPNHPEIAVKTGTSNNLRDNLTVGYNQDYLVAVWVGNNDNSQMSRIASGLTGASSIWNKAMLTLTSNTESRAWEIPQGLIRLPTCPYTGTLYCNGCPSKMEWFLAENAPDKSCSPEWFEEKQEEEQSSGSEIIREIRRTTRN